MTLMSAVILSMAALHNPAADDVEQIAPSVPPIECSRAKAARVLAKRGAAAAKNIEDPNSYKTDVQHYRLDFEVDPDAHTFSGSTTMTVASRVESLSTFRFWLNTSMAIESVEVDGEDVEWRRRGRTTVDVELNRSYGVDEVFDIEVSYSGSPVLEWFFATQDGSPIIATLSQPWHAADWWAVKDDNSDKATGELLVTVPSELTVVSNGLLVATDNVGGGRRRFHWRTEYPTSPYLFSFAATVYNTFSSNFHHDEGSTPVDFFIYPGSDTTANRNGWRRTVDMLSTFEDLFGPYPFREEKYAIYQFQFGGGMEHQTATGQGGDYAFSQYLTSHELAHQWWGDMLTCDTWHDVWLNEGFATYSTALWLEFASGTSDADARRAYMEHWRPDEFEGSVYVHDISDENRIFSSNYSYGKAAWVVHMLRGVVGDDIFLEILAAYRARYEYATATTEDFRAVAEEVWGGDLEWFFDQWVYGGGAPAYRYGWQEHEVDGRRFLELFLEQGQSEGAFQMPVEVVTLERGERRSYTVWNDARAENLLIPVTAEVGDVELDPHDWILARFMARRPFSDGPPKVVAIDPAPGTSLPVGRPFSVTVTFHRDVAAADSDFVLRRSDGLEFDLDLAYDAATFTATLATQEPLTFGRFQLIVGDGIVDAEDGLALDGELDVVHGGPLPSGDGVAGGDAVIEYRALGLRRATGRFSPAP
jgi:aminopeptidase N